MANPEKNPAESNQAKDEPTVTPVLNNTERLIQCSTQGSQGRGGDIQPGKRVDLLPGMNFPETKLWNKAKEAQGCRDLLKTKIEPNKAPEQSPERVGKYYLEERKPISKDNPLMAVSEESALEMVDEMFSVPMMKKFLDQEERGAVIKALKGQIHKIENPVVKKAV